MSLAVGREPQHEFEQEYLHPFISESDGEGVHAHLGLPPDQQLLFMQPHNDMAPTEPIEDIMTPCMRVDQGAKGLPGGYIPGEIVHQLHPLCEEAQPDNAGGVYGTHLMGSLHTHPQPTSILKNPVDGYQSEHDELGQVHNMPPASFKGLYVHHQKREVRVIYYSYERKHSKPIRRQCSFSFNAYGFDGANTRAQNLIAYIKSYGTLPKEYANPSRRLAQKPKKKKVVPVTGHGTLGSCHLDDHSLGGDGADDDWGAKSLSRTSYQTKKKATKAKNRSTDQDTMSNSFFSGIFSPNDGELFLPKCLLPRQGPGRPPKNRNKIRQQQALLMAVLETNSVKWPLLFVNLESNDVESTSQYVRQYLYVVHSHTPHLVAMCKGLHDRILGYLDSPSLASMEGTNRTIRNTVLQSNHWWRELTGSGFETGFTPMDPAFESYSNRVQSALCKAQLVTCCGCLNRMWARMACQEFLLHLRYQHEIERHTTNEEDWELTEYKHLAQEALQNLVQYDFQAERCKASLRGIQTANPSVYHFESLLAAPWASKSVISNRDILESSPSKDSLSLTS